MYLFFVYAFNSTNSTFVVSTKKEIHTMVTFSFNGHGPFYSSCCKQKKFDFVHSSCILSAFAQEALSNTFPNFYNPFVVMYTSYIFFTLK